MCKESHVLISTIMKTKCINCGDGFLPKSKGYRRQSSQKQINEGENVGEALENIFDATFSPFGKATDKYLCHVCYGLLEKTRKKKKESNVAENELMKRTVEGTYISRKRKRCVNSPSSTPRRLKKSKDFKEHILKKSAKKITFVKKAVMAIQRHDYESAVNILFRSSVRARRQVLNVVRNKVKKEVGNYVKNSEAKHLTKETCETFQWDSVISEINANLPVLSLIIHSALTTQRNSDIVDIQGDGTCGKLTPAYGTLMYMILHLRRRKFNIIQGFNSIQMYKSGCSQNVRMNDSIVLEFL
ncbi:uncharacterized protein LOC144349629 [Saccoglossus kowalevskii]